MASEWLPAAAGATSDHWIHIAESPRRVRVKFGGETVADTRRPRLLFETGSEIRR